MEAHHLPLADLMSPARYAKYEAAAQGDAARAARLYVWNCRLAAAYWPSISLVEVAVRNAIDVQLCTHLNVSRDHGWHHDALSERPRLHLTQKERDKVKKSIEFFERNQPSTGAEHDLAEPTGGDVVSGLSLGFWVALVGEGVPRGEGRHLYDYFQRLWRPFLHQAFPLFQGPAQNKPGPIRGALREFELLRNRIAHHEPIYMLNHRHHRDNIIAIAGWLNADLAEYLRHTEQVSDVLADYARFVRANAAPLAAVQ
ncbi:MULTISPECIES: CAAX protease [Mycolicibacter]|uniref:CAAX protease n=2 Tax=Mycolicibacter TaxID=1073531 RepID=A0ABU5XMQ8_9MYCO|nr:MULTISPECIES: CAAX protease [unclassified Mycolicibacter]MEB3023473.1 CAAX protease [Mycolicibacter sp. MYC098]MEB3035106.1 CAAX protease [Mycolicibacter sp. MYC340]